MDQAAIQDIRRSGYIDHASSDRHISALIASNRDPRVSAVVHIDPSPSASLEAFMSLIVELFTATFPLWLPAIHIPLLTICCMLRSSCLVSTPFSFRNLWMILKRCWSMTL